MIINKYILFILISFCSVFVYGQNSKYILTNICVQHSNSNKHILGAKVILQEQDFNGKILATDTLKSDVFLSAHFDKARKYRIRVEKEGFYMVDTLVMPNKEPHIRKQRLGIFLDPEVCFYLKGRVVSVDNTTNILAGKLQIQDLSTNKNYEIAIENGSYEFCGKCRHEYQLKAIIDGYLGGEKDILLNSPNCKKHKVATSVVDIELVEDYNKSFYSGATITLPNLRFIGTTVELTVAGKKELDRLIKIMKQMPNLWLTIKVQTAPYQERHLNRKLVEKRARFLDKKLIEGGISSYRYLLICDEKRNRSREQQGIKLWKRER